MSITVYQYPGCSTCRRALKWLDQKGVPYKSVHIVEHPPTAALLKQHAASIRAISTKGEIGADAALMDALPHCEICLLYTSDAADE